MRTIQSEFNRHGLLKAEKAPPVRQPKPKEQFSKWELEELMGYKRDTFKRKNGAIHRR